jgi:uncharacterized protein (TIGR03435 family)
MTKSVCICLLLSASLWAQPGFEVASVKLHQPGPGPLRVQTSVEPAGIHFTNVTLKACIRQAYELEPYRIFGGPDWLTSERYDITAKAAAAESRAQLMRMLQALLEERFQLKLHREIREMPVYALVVAKNGPKLHAAKVEGETEIGGADGHRFSGKGVTMKMFAGALSRSQPWDRPILDMTGLTGAFDISLDFARDDGAAPADSAAGPSIFAALQEQLGLKLEPRKSPMEVLVIDSAVKSLAELRTAPRKNYLQSDYIDSRLKLSVVESKWPFQNLPGSNFRLWRRCGAWAPARFGKFKRPFRSRAGRPTPPCRPPYTAWNGKKPCAASSESATRIFSRP